MATNFLQGLFEGQPRTVFDAYADTANALNKLRSQRISNALSQIKLNYAPQMAQQAADEGAADVSIKQNQAKYAPLLSSLTVQQKQIENAMNNEKFKYLPSDLQAGLALKHAQLDKIKQDIELAPRKLKAEEQRSGIIAASQPYKNLSHLTKAQKEQIGATNAAAISANMQSGFNNISQGIGQSAPNSISGANTSQGAAQLPPLDNAAQGLQFSSQIAANKGAVSSYSTKRLDNSIEIEKFLQDPKMDVYAAAAARYAGIAGKGKAALEAWKRDNPEEYEENIFFRNALKSALVNMNKNLEGLSVHVSQRKELTGNLMQAFDQFSSNPERAWDQWKRAKETFHDISKANSVAAQPIYPGVREKAAGLNYDDNEDLNRMVDIKINGKRASIPLKNLHKALDRGAEMDLGD